jgi:predicted secreted protein
MKLLTRAKIKIVFEIIFDVEEYRHNCDNQGNERGLKEMHTQHERCSKSKYSRTVEGYRHGVLSYSRSYSVCASALIAVDHGSSDSRLCLQLGNGHDLDRCM